MTRRSVENRHDSLLKLYIAEYQVLRNGATNWSVLQYGLLPVVPVYLALAANVWEMGVLVKWLSFAGLQMIGIFWSQTMLEQFTLVKYMECHLRPLIKNIVSSEMFFGWEPYLISKRHINPIWGALFIPLLSSLLFLALTIVRFIEGVSVWDLAGAIINAILLLILARNCYVSNRLMLDWSEFDKNLAEDISKISKTGLSEN